MGPFSTVPPRKQYESFYMSNFILELKNELNSLEFASRINLRLDH